MFLLFVLPAIAAAFKAASEGTRTAVLGGELEDAEFELTICATEKELRELQEMEGGEMVKRMAARAQVKAATLAAMEGGEA